MSYFTGGGYKAYKKGPAIRYKKGPSIRYICSNLRDFFVKGSRYKVHWVAESRKKLSYIGQKHLGLITVPIVPLN